MDDGPNGKRPDTPRRRDSTNDPPEVPKERPKTSPERSAAARLAAKVLGPAATVAEIAKLSTWMVPYATGIISYSDPPRSLEELQDAVSSPEPGYDVHHIVERASALEDGFPMSGVDSRDNLVLIPRMKHWDINSWYQTPNVEYDWQTPREYLSGRNWDVRRAVGLNALKDAAVPSATARRTKKAKSIDVPDARRDGRA